MTVRWVHGKAGGIEILVIDDESREEGEAGTVYASRMAAGPHNQKASRRIPTMLVDLFQPCKPTLLMADYD